MRLTVDISDDPRSGFKRKVEVLENVHIYIEGQSKTGIKLLVTYYDNDGNKVHLDPVINVNKRFDPFIVKLLADSNMVNPLDGSKAEEEYFDEEGGTGNRVEVSAAKSFKYIEGSVREYDYFASLSPAKLGLTADASILDIMNAVYTATILKKDSEGRFD